MDTSTNSWTAWIPPYDPRMADGVKVSEDEHGRLIETADCGQRCPGCGICCADYRDVIDDDYRGEDEFDLNLKATGARGGLVKAGENWFYRGANCGKNCPGYERCCPPFEQRDRPKDVADARRVLLERPDARRWEMQEALLVLAHDGSPEAVETLRTYLPRAHRKMEGFAECALDEGEYFNTVPKNEAEARQMMQQEVRDDIEDRAIEAETEIGEDIHPELERLRYELEIVRRLMDKATDEQSRDDWRIQVDVLEMLIGQEEDRKAEREADLARYNAMIAEIEADLQKKE